MYYSRFQNPPMSNPNLSKTAWLLGNFHGFHEIYVLNPAAGSVLNNKWYLHWVFSHEIIRVYTFKFTDKTLIDDNDHCLHLMSLLLLEILE